MASATQATFWQSVFSASFYKKNQGKIVRFSTAAALILGVLLGSWTFSVRVFDDWISQLIAAFPAMTSTLKILQIAVPLLMAVLGSWIAWRAVQYPPAADFLIDVESEMAKVTWPERTELIRATGVVLFVTISLSLILFGFDLFWQWLLGLAGVLQIYNQ